LLRRNPLVVKEKPAKVEDSEATTEMDIADDPAFHYGFESVDMAKDYHENLQKLKDLLNIKEIPAVE